MLKRDDALRTVTMFLTNDECGTGFFIRKEDKLYLITANHVAKTFNANTEIVFSGVGGFPVRVKLATLQIGSLINHAFADVSAIVIDEAIFNTHNPTVIIYDYSLLDNSEHFTRDTELTAIGFPNGLGASFFFQPFTFRSFPSSNIIPNVSLERGAYTEDAFFLENAGCGGFSGCPVIDLYYMASEGSIIQKDGVVLIHGVMHGTMNDKTGGKMAIVTPSKYILDII